MPHGILRTSLVLVLAIVCPALTFAKNPDEWRKAAKKFKKGDKVEVTRFDKKSKGVVTEITGLGQVRVATKEFPHSWPYEPDKVRLLSRKDKASIATGKEANPFATDEEKYQEVGKRTWSDRSGKFRIEATIVRIDGDNVVLKRTDNKEISVDRAKLSDEDQAILNKVAGTSEGDDADAEEFPDDAPLLDVELVETKIATATPVDLTGASDWKVKPDPLTARRKPARIALPDRRDIFDHVESVLLPPGNLGYVIVSSNQPRGAPTRIFACDLDERKLVKAADFYADQVPLDVTPDGKKLISRSHGLGFGQNNLLFMFELDQFKTTPKYQWQPYDDQRMSSRQDIDAAQFIDTDHVVTLSNEGHLAMWDVSNKVRPVYAAKTDNRGANFGFSPNRKYLIVNTARGFAFLDPMSGESQGFLPAESQVWHSAFAVHPDGVHLALVDAGRIRVWNLESRELLRDFCLAEGVRAESLVWCDDERIMTGSGDLIDIERRIKLWSYSNIDSPVATTGDAIWGVSGARTETDSLLIGAKIPHGEASRAAQQLDAESLLVIRPGMEVSLQLNFAGAPAEQASVRQALTDRLEHVGMKVVPQGQVVLSATIRPGESQTVQYRAFGGSDYSQHTVQTQVLELAYLINNKPVWKHTQQSWTPTILHMKQGENINQALAREMKQDSKTFESIFVPGYVAAPLPMGAGQSPWAGG